MFNEHGQDATYWNPEPGSFAATAKSYIPENVWNESCSTAQCGAQKANLWAGGGGASKFFGKPSWQAGVAGIPNDGKRDLPDVSLSAAGHDPYLICYERSCVSSNEMFGISGTSASTPSFAGIMALINHKDGRPPGTSQLRPLPFGREGDLFPMQWIEDYRRPGRDVRLQRHYRREYCGSRAIRIWHVYRKYQATAAYDPATGLGSVNVNNLANQWGSVTFDSTTTTLALTPLTIAHGSPVTVNICRTERRKRHAHGYGSFAGIIGYGRN